MVHGVVHGPGPWGGPWTPVHVLYTSVTKLGPWLFILFINDLDTNSPYLWNFVDDTTASEQITEHRSLLCSELFDQICSDTGHKLNSLLPPRNEPKYNLRNHRPFAIPHFKTNPTKTRSSLPWLANVLIRFGFKRYFDCRHQ